MPLACVFKRGAATLSAPLSHGLQLDSSTCLTCQGAWSWSARQCGSSPVADTDQRQGRQTSGVGWAKTPLLRRRQCWGNIPSEWYRWPPCMPNNGGQPGLRHHVWHRRKCGGSWDWKRSRERRSLRKWVDKNSARVAPGCPTHAARIRLPQLRSPWCHLLQRIWRWRPQWEGDSWPRLLGETKAWPRLQAAAWQRVHSEPCAKLLCWLEAMQASPKRAWPTGTSLPAQAPGNLPLPVPRHLVPREAISVGRAGRALQLEGRNHNLTGGIVAPRSAGGNHYQLKLPCTTPASLPWL